MTIRGRIFQSDFLRRVGLLASATAIGQLIAVLASPLLTRLYSPDEFGIFSVFIAILSLVLVVSGLRFELAIPLPRHHSSAFQLVVLALCINAAVAVFVLLVLVIVREPIAALAKTPALANYLLILPAAVFFAGAYRIFNYWAIRRHNYGLVARTKLSQSVTNIGIQITTGIAHFGVSGLIVGYILGQVAGVISLARFLKESMPTNVRFSVRRMGLVARRQLNFARYDAPASVIDTASEQLPAILLATLFSPAIAGFYMLAQRTLSLPSAVIGQALGQVLYGQCRQAIADRQLGKIVWKMVYILFGVILVPTIIVMAWGGEIFGLVFGAAWQQSGQFAAWLIIAVAMQFIYSPISMALMATEGQHINLLIHSILLVTRLAGILWGWMHDDAVLAIELFSVSSLFGFALGIVLVIKRAIAQDNLVGT